MHSWFIEAGAIGAIAAFIISAVTAEHDTDHLIGALVFASALGFLWLVVRAAIFRFGTGAIGPAASRSLSSQIELAATSKELPAPGAVEKLMSTRRSIFPRDFNGSKVSDAQIERLLEAANWAPTHGLTEPWRFVVIGGAAKDEFEDMTIRLCQTKLPTEKAEKVVAKLTSKKTKDWLKVSHYIAIGMKRQAVAEKLMPESEEICATACAVQNMLLLMTAMGLAGYWTSWQEAARDSSEMKEWLGLEEQDRCLGCIVLGISDRADGYRGSRRPIEQKVTWKS